MTTHHQKRIGKGVKYTVIGAGVVNIFLQLMNFVMLFYSIVIVENNTLSSIFPSLINFAIIGVVVWSIALFIVGWIWRHSDFYLADREVDVNTDVYNTRRFTPIMLPVWKVMLAYVKGEKPEANDLAKVELYIKNSEVEK